MRMISCALQLHFFTGNKQKIMHLKIKNKKEYICKQVRTEYKIAHQYKVLKSRVSIFLICALKLFTLAIARTSFGREFHSVGAATIKALSPNVFDRTAGI